MDTKQLKQKILDLAIRGKLVSQDPNDEPASVLLERIKAEKAKLVKAKKIKKDKNPSEIVVGADGATYEKFEDGKSKDISDEPPFDLPQGWGAAATTRPLSTPCAPKTAIWRSRSCPIPSRSRSFERDIRAVREADNRRILYPTSQ